MLLALFAALAVALTACGGDDGGASDEDPQAVLDQTFSGDRQIESAELDLSFDIAVEGEQGGNVEATLSGPVDGRGEGFPQFDLTASVSGEGGGQSLSFDGSAISTGDAAYVEYQDQAYELGPDLFGLLEQAYAQSQAQQTQGSSSAGVEELRASLINLQNEGTEDVEGTETVHVSGEVDVRKLVTELGPLLEQASQFGGAGAAGLPSEQDLQQLEQLVESATFDVYSGTEDDILRRFDIAMTLTQPSSGDTADLTFSLTLGNVNGDVSIEAPSDAQPIEQLFRELGVDPSALGALGGLGGASAGGSAGSAGSGSGGGATGGGDATAFFDCLEGAQTAAEIQACSELAPAP
jgi:hypothetical protein